MKDDLEALLERWPLAKEFNLPPESYIVVIGAYKGITMELMRELYHPQWMIGYDPQRWALDEAHKRLDYNSNDYALIGAALVTNEDAKSDLPMGEWNTDACSLINIGPGSRQQGVALTLDAEFALGLHKGPIDLMIMNIEGYEFKLLPYLAEKNILEKINRLAVQWHFDLAHGLSEGVMDRAILGLDDIGLKLAIDDRPAWTYHVRS